MARIVQILKETSKIENSPNCLVASCGKLAIVVGEIGPFVLIKVNPNSHFGNGSLEKEHFTKLLACLPEYLEEVLSD